MVARAQRYDPREIEPRWQAEWQRTRLYEPDLHKAELPFYNLMMFPYPSAEGLHVGNVYAFVGADVYGRFMAMQGRSVFEPIGFDAFGIHSENFAIQRGAHPKVLTAQNVERFRVQLRRTGNRFDWSHEVLTTDPAYYRWTQWIFVQLFRAGLAVRKRAAVNWCPKDKTVLADEQVIDGRCERCDTPVVQRELEQWFFRITAYAERLLDDLDRLDWSEAVKTAQRNWIGRSEGLEFELAIGPIPPAPVSRTWGTRTAPPRPVVGSHRRSAPLPQPPPIGGSAPGTLSNWGTRAVPQPPPSGGSAPGTPSREGGDGSAEASRLAPLSRAAGEGANVTVFTTRPDTVFGVTYIVLAPEHPLVERIVTEDRRAAVAAYREATRHRSELERLAAGAREKTGEFTGAYAVNPVNGERVPIWVADYVLMSYGSGAIMAVPAHDERDFAFAAAFGLPVRTVVAPLVGQVQQAPVAHPAEAYTGGGVLVESGAFTGVPSGEGSRQIVEWFEEHGVGRRTVQYRLRDWLISRQRYWGPPIPIVYCDDCGTLPVPEAQLPVLLPELEDWLPTGTGASPLAQIPEFVNTTCPACGGPARRETDVSDNFLDSAWYFLRYPSTEENNRPFDPELTRRWLPVDMYIGGPEHSVLHLLYSRFITMTLHDLGHLHFPEPFRRFRAHGILTKDSAKMSKSRGNVINPDDYLDKYGADTLRMYLLFLGPFEQGGAFTDRGIGGTARFLQRIWNLVHRYMAAPSDDPLGIDAKQDLHRTVHRVAGEIPALKYNTAMAALMEYLNALQRRPAQHGEEIESLLVLLAPFAPHITEELWARLGKPYSIHQQPFPRADAALLVQERVGVAVQVNGRTRGVVDLPPAASEAEALAAARTLSSVQSRLVGAPVRRVIYVPEKVINIVTSSE